MIKCHSSCCLKNRLEEVNIWSLERSRLIVICNNLRMKCWWLRQSGCKGDEDTWQTCGLFLKEKEWELIICGVGEGLSEVANGGYFYWGRERDLGCVCVFVLKAILDVKEASESIVLKLTWDYYLESYQNLGNLWYHKKSRQHSDRKSREGKEISENETWGMPAF